MSAHIAQIALKSALIQEVFCSWTLYGAEENVIVSWAVKGIRANLEAGRNDDSNKT